MKEYTYAELIIMPIEERKLIAQDLLTKNLTRTTPRMDREWGRFTDFEFSDEQAIAEEVDRLLGIMSLEQKINQMTPNTTVNEYIPACLKYNDFPYIAGEDYSLEIPGIRFSDGPTGVVMGNESTCFPVAIARGASWDEELEEQIGEAIGLEARSLGANLVGSVCINLLRHPSWGRSQETYGEDPLLLGAMGSASVKGLQKYVMACVKHFALNSMENSRYKVNVSIDERSLREIYLPHFRECVNVGAAAFMSSYNKVRGEYAGENAYLIKKLLRDTFGFTGFVISDFVYGLYNAKKAVAAGLDIEMPVEGHYGRNLLKLTASGEVPVSMIDDSARRIMRTKLKFSKILEKCDDQKLVFSKEDHHELALKAALHSTVLLKNKNQLLPLSLKKTTHLVVLGRLANHENIGEMKGSSHVYPPYIITPLTGLKNKLPDGTVLEYFEDLKTEQSMNSTAGADAVIIVVGLTSDDEGEYIPHWDTGCGGDRDTLRLKYEEEMLIHTSAGLNDRTIIVMQGGGTIITDPWDSEIGALLMTWYPGMEGGKALAEVIFGDFNPCAKLPVSFPASPDQLPLFDKDLHEITYDYYHGYFLVDKMKHSVSYPFGYGLSFTEFTYGNLSVSGKRFNESDTIKVSVDVTNSGERDGYEITQLYSGYLKSPVPRHVKDLRAFKKTFIEAGKTREITFRIPVSSLAYFDDSESAWRVGRHEYLILVGSSSQDDDLLKTQICVV